VQASKSASDKEDSDEELSELSGEELDDSDSDGEQDGSEQSSDNVENDDDASSVDEEAGGAQILEAVVAQGSTDQDEGRKRKRKQRDEREDLEASYFKKLIGDEPSGKRVKAGKTDEGDDKAEGKNKTDEEDEDASMDEVPVHESIAKPDAAAIEIEKANRTVFLSNVDTECITSRTAKKTLMKHLASVLDKNASPPQKVESIRFRSTAFETAAIPKRAAYIKKNVMEATTKSTNAYVVYSTIAASRLAVSKLNGTVVLDRHLRVDSVAHPAPVDHRRCVFVGNLGFMDDETVLSTKVDEEGKEVTEKRKRTKVPMDVEEGLWRVFGKEAGKVESVRVVRDPVTRVGKGIAYVQFYDGNSVESAVLLNGKKFPPMLPRELRVSRCKAPHKTARAIEAKMAKHLPAKDAKGRGKGGSDYVPKVTPENKTLAGRASKLLGRSAAEKFSDDKKKQRREAKLAKRHANRGFVPQPKEGGEMEHVQKPLPGGIGRTPEDIIFEGRRASAKDGRPKDLKFKGSKAQNKKKAMSAAGASSKGRAMRKGGRGAERAAKWKKAGGAKK